MFLLLCLCVSCLGDRQKRKEIKSELSGSKSTETNNESSSQLSLLFFPKCFTYSTTLFLNNNFFPFDLPLSPLNFKENGKEVTCSWLIAMTAPCEWLKINAILLSLSPWSFGEKDCSSLWVSTFSQTHISLIPFCYGKVVFLFFLMN